MSQNGPRLSDSIAGKLVAGGVPLNGQTLQFNSVTNLWEFVSGGGGLTFARVVKSIDETINNSIVLQDDDELKFTPNINKTYHFIILLVLQSVAAADFKYAFSIPAGASGVKQTGNEWAGNAPKATSTLVTSQNLLTNNAVQMSELHGSFIMAGTAGDFILQWAQRVSNPGDTAVLQGSLLSVWEGA